MNCLFYSPWETMRLLSDVREIVKSEKSYPVRVEGGGRGGASTLCLSLYPRFTCAL